MEVSSFSDIEKTFLERVQHVVWCNVATIDAHNRQVEWVDDLAQKQQVWQLCKETPPPVGFDPEPIYERADHPNFGVLKLIPWHIEIANFPAESLIWHPKEYQSSSGSAMAPI